MTMVSLKMIATYSTLQAKEYEYNRLISLCISLLSVPRPNAYLDVNRTTILEGWGGPIALAFGAVFCLVYGRSMSRLLYICEMVAPIIHSDS